uniref:Ig-like domain-containing protein n=1 Tax=Leptobrachium leishanense TaxID=445787 RepID=A0A8C5W9L4_9ANUR
MDEQTIISTPQFSFLLFTVPPKIQVSSKEVSEEKVKTLICSVNGFYPGDITITWLKDEEVLQNSSLAGRLSSINILLYLIQLYYLYQPDTL